MDLLLPVVNKTQPCCIIDSSNTRMSSRGVDDTNTNTNNNENNPHATQWERQEEWLIRLRAHKQQLAERGVQGWDLLEAMATMSLEHKIRSCQPNRCPNCWHDTHCCICQHLQPITVSWNAPVCINICICILMHHKEYLCAGNSAKLLLSLLPHHTKLYIFGKQGDVDRLEQDIAVVNSHAMILWPGETAISVSEFVDNLSTTSIPTTSITTPTTIHVIVLDGTYTQARNMHKSLRKRWNQLPTAVAVNPTSASVFHRAQKNYGQAQLQAQADVLRVSTAEACGFLWTELGAATKSNNSTTVLQAIVDAVVKNNEALAFARNSGK